MNEAIDAIVESLRELTRLHRQLTAIGEDKRQAIADNRTDALMGLAAQENRIVKAVNEQDRVRAEAVRRFAVDAGIRAAAHVRIEQVIRTVTRLDQKQTLQQAADELSKAIATLREVNNFNQQLLRMQLDYVNFALDLIAGPGEDEATYHRSLRDQGFSRIGQFDAKA